MSDSHYFRLGCFYVHILWTWMTINPSALGLETYHTHVTWVWQSCLTHVYLGLIKMLDSCYFGLGWLPRSCILDLAGTKSKRLRSSKQAQPCLFGFVNHVWPIFTWVCQACQFHVALDLVDWPPCQCTLDLVSATSKCLGSDKHGKLISYFVLIPFIEVLFCFFSIFPSITISYMFCFLFQFSFF
jgi:hypothetical protein